MMKLYNVTVRQRCVTHEEADLSVPARNKREALAKARAYLMNPETDLDWHPQGDLSCTRLAPTTALLVSDEA